MTSYVKRCAIAVQERTGREITDGESAGLEKRFQKKKWLETANLDVLFKIENNAKRLAEMIPKAFILCETITRIMRRQNITNVKLGNQER